jgi:tRNA-2-methylthio-N6-dimethylallyladenosine synthase
VKKYLFETYGCQMNLAESAALSLAAKERGWEEAAGEHAPHDADLVLLNTCSVRATAEERVMGRLGYYAALKKQRAGEGRPFTLVVAGCMAERLGGKLKADCPAVDYVMGTQARSFFPVILEAVEQGRAAAETGERPTFSFSSSHLEEGRFRSFIPIMHGCDNFCSYCIVPYVRGREISRSPDSVMEEIRLVGGRGVREITLLGQNVNSYRYKDVDFPRLLELVAREVNATPIRWVRFLSSHPKDLSDRAVAVMADNPVFCRHLHLCVQHGSDAILQKMNRRYTRDQYRALVKTLRAAMPGLSLSTDILVGFPGESEADFEETVALMEEVRFSYAYMYHYNPREGTAAYTLPGRVPDEVKGRRLSAVIETQQRLTGELMAARVGAEAVVLIEGISRKNADELVTRTERDEMAVVPGTASRVGRFGRLRLSELRGTTFRAGEITLLD